MRYLLIVEKGITCLKDIKQDIINRKVDYSILSLDGRVINHNLNTLKEKETYIFSIPDDIDNIEKYFLNNINSLDIVCPNMGNVFDIGSRLYLFGDVLEVGDYILSIFNEKDVFYLRRYDNNSITIEYKDLLNILGIYYDKVLNEYLDLQNIKITYINALDKKFMKIFVNDLKKDKELIRKR